MTRKDFELIAQALRVSYAADAVIHAVAEALKTTKPRFDTARFIAACKTTTNIPDVGRLMAFENGELDLDETIELFQDLIDSGLAWQLQGFYGRTAARLIEAGYCHQPQEA